MINLNWIKTKSQFSHKKRINLTGEHCFYSDLSFSIYTYTDNNVKYFYGLLVDNLITGEQDRYELDTNNLTEIKKLASELLADY